ncbi:hypothetical protein H0E87_028024 [Populus deltoides]|uniref:Uncharacterized protein n=1 Tax=Populus deltoides TaxID=3696 RepID=A0A8T2WRR6_POPDE|nr:hypothetical protein H0E87_028024 [Populus deltoides]
MVMTAPLLVLAPGLREENTASAGDGEEIWTTGIIAGRARRAGRHLGLPPQLVPLPAGLKRSCLDRGGESGGDGEKPKRKKERNEALVFFCSGDRGKMCFGFENGDGKGSSGEGKNGDGELTEKGAAAFWRRDGDGGTTRGEWGSSERERGQLWPKRDPLFPPREGPLFLFSKDEQGLRVLR